MRFDTFKEIQDYFNKHNFTEYKPTPFDRESCVTCFQKRYDDDIGKKYFLDCKIYDYTFTDRIPENYVGEFEGQYYQKDTHDAVNFTFIGWELEQIEMWLEQLFEAGFIEHYEKW